MQQGIDPTTGLSVWGLGKLSVDYSKQSPLS